MAVEALVELCSQSDDLMVLGNATHALRNLARHEAMRVLIVEEGAVRPLVEICSKMQDEQVLGYAVACVANLAVDEGCGM